MSSSARAPEIKTPNTIRTRATLCKVSVVRKCKLPQIGEGKDREAHQQESENTSDDKLPKPALG